MDEFIYLKTDKSKILCNQTFPGHDWLPANNG